MKGRCPRPLDDGGSCSEEDPRIVAKGVAGPVWVDVRRYRLGVLEGRGDRRAARRVVGGLSIAAAVLLGAACSGSSSGSTVGSGATGVSATVSAAATRATCAQIRRLPLAAQPLVNVPLSDPVRFDAALRVAVAAYTHTLDAIASSGPASLRRPVEVLRSAVEQHKFADAQAARAPLDDWAAEHCT